MQKSLLSGGGWVKLLVQHIEMEILPPTYERFHAVLLGQHQCI